VHHNALAPASSPKEVEKNGFAHTLAATLDQAMRSGRLRKRVLVAPPHFLGLMRKELMSELEKHLLTTVDKDFNDLAVHELSERLRDAVRVSVSDHESIREDRKRPH
jgi:protein required for attachment to host cells